MGQLVRLPYFEQVGVYALYPKSQIWHQEKLRYQSIMDTTVPRMDLKVCVVDTGVDGKHDELIGRVVKHKDFTGEGFEKIHPHGTHVAGSIVGRNVGMFPYAKILDAKTLESTGRGDSRYVANGIRWGADEGAHIINLSLGSSSLSLDIKQAIDYAREKGCYVIAAAGNEGKQGVGYPGKLDNVVAVAACGFDSEWYIPDFSSIGPSTDYAAPGVEIISCIPGNKYAAYNGTSMGTPVSVTLWCWLISKFGFIGQETILEKIKSNAIDILSKGEDDFSGAGIINPLKSLEVIPKEPETPTEPEKPVEPIKVDNRFWIFLAILIAILTFFYLKFS